MIILHENLFPESKHVSKVLKKTFGFNSQIKHRNLSDCFVKIPEFRGYLESNLIENVVSKFNGKSVMFITSRDLYFDDKNLDDWIFGCCYPNGKYAILSTARLKGDNSNPTTNLGVSKQKYLRRLEMLAIHEIGHDVIYPKKLGIASPGHFMEASWVRSDGYELKLGPHCTNNKCVMYESVDISAPKASEGYMKVGKMKKYDAGFDEMLNRVKKDWFCKKCKESIHIDSSYI